MNVNMNVTFDTNCLVDLELNEGAAPQLLRIVEAHESNQITISVPGIGASERLKDGTFAETFSLFMKRVNKLAKREFEILKPLAYFDLTYFDWSILGGDEIDEIESRIHEILFPETMFRWADQASACGLDPNQAAKEHNTEWLKWRNRKCDTLALWCHIHYKKDVFITQDSNFHKVTKKSTLEKLGAKSILFPLEISL